MKLSTLILPAWLSLGSIYAADFYSAPVVRSFEPSSAEIGTHITIFGKGFSRLPWRNIVYFGATRAEVKASPGGLLVVKVPAGATYSRVSVMVNGLTGSSAEPFSPTFLGANVLKGFSSSSRIDLSTGDGPLHVALGDLDGDGMSDVSVADDYGSTISVYRNTTVPGESAAPSFAPRVILPTPPGTYGPFFLVTADLDSDGRLDLVTVNRDQNSVSIYRNRGIPGKLTEDSFDSRVDLPLAAGALPQGLEVVDLDRDGRVDLVTANVGTDSVSILRNVGRPGRLAFAPNVDLLAGDGPVCVAVADLDRDQRSDLVVANLYSGTVSVFRNVTGDSGDPRVRPASFAQRLDLVAGAGVKTVACGDLDGDGRTEIVAGSWNANLVHVFLNKGSPGNLNGESFGTRIDHKTGGNAHTVAIADVDGDAMPDVVLTTELPSHLSVFKNVSRQQTVSIAPVPPDRPKLLGERVDFPSAWNAVGVAIGDIDADGRPELLFANTYDDLLSIYPNKTPVISRR